MQNIWLSLKKANIIAQDLESEFKGLIVSEDHILDAMWGHYLYEDHMWLDVDWNNDDEVISISVGVGGGIII